MIPRTDSPAHVWASRQAAPQTSLLSALPKLPTPPFYSLLWPCICIASQTAPGESHIRPHPPPSPGCSGCLAQAPSDNAELLTRSEKLQLPLGSSDSLHTSLIFYLLFCVMEIPFFLGHMLSDNLDSSSLDFVPLVNIPIDHMRFFSQMKQESLPLNPPFGILSQSHFQRHQSPHFSPTYFWFCPWLLLLLEP